MRITDPMHARAGWIRLVAHLVLAITLLTGLPGCGGQSGLHIPNRRSFPVRDDPAARDSLLTSLRYVSSHASPFLKAHLKNGNVYVLTDWAADPQSISGEGVLLSINREILSEGQFVVTLDSVSIIETNVVKKLPDSVAALTVLTGISVAVSLACLSNPKACFGSCPTFFISDGDSLVLQAEGFSSSIAPYLEATDIDALYRADIDDETVEIEMRNEAFETHVIRQVRLLLLKKPVKGRVVAAGNGEFWEAQSFYPPQVFRTPEGDCTDLVLTFDGRERFSLADSVDLSRRETVDLEFHVPPIERPGLIIAARRSLLTTYLLYQTLAYMGGDVGQWFSLADRNRDLVKGKGLWQAMDGMEVMVLDSAGNWDLVGELTEHGPIATDVHMFRLPTLPEGTARMRLRMVKGDWRIDYLALVSLGDQVEPMALQPSDVFYAGLPSGKALASLTDSGAVLVTYPGDTYTLRYDLPRDHQSYELFLESRGYYLEWIRQEWLADEDPALVAQVFFSPGILLKKLAGEFKRVEATMEESFWGSRYANP